MPPKPQKPLVFPLPFKVFLRHAVTGKRSYGERLPIFKKYWCSKLEYFARIESKLIPGLDNQTPEGRLDMALKVIEKYQREGVDESFFITHVNGVAHWRKEEQIFQRRNAAKSRWAKVRSKTLDASKIPKK